MRQSRFFISALNDTASRGSDPGDLDRLETIVRDWIYSGSLSPGSLRWLNSQYSPGQLKLKPSSDTGIPKVDIRHHKETTPGQKAATSFITFLAEIADHQQGEDKKASRPPEVKECPVCSEFFVQETAGREKELCSTRCTFRLRRIQEKLDPETRELLDIVHRALVRGKKQQRKQIEKVAEKLEPAPRKSVAKGLSREVGESLVQGSASEKQQIKSLAKMLLKQLRKS